MSEQGTSRLPRLGVSGSLRASPLPCHPRAHALAPRIPQLDGRAQVWVPRSAYF